VKALVTAEFTTDGLARLEALGYTVTQAGWGVTRKALSADELRVAADGVDLVITEIEVVDAALLAAVPSLRLVATARGGPVNVDLAACAERDLPVLFTPARNADSVADFVVGTILSLVRGIGASERHLRDEGWHVGGELPYLHFRGPELSRLVVGVVGNGAIGSRVAQRLTDGFGTRVIVHDPVQGVGPTLPELADQVDLLTLHCPRVPATRGLVDAALLARLGAGWVVNTAGGGIVDEDALCDALDAGALRGAALDCFSTEPLPRDSRLLRTPDLLLTPHLAGAADDVVRHHTDLICADIERWHRGDPLLHRAGPPVFTNGDA
jgi:D-3-phosphoglycerate dehydrogenase